MNRELFFERIGRTLFQGRLPLHCKRGMEVKMDMFDACGVWDDRHRAYMMATAYHETGGTMLPVEEGGKGRKMPYGTQRKHDGSPYVWPHKLYYGRGDVQLTWYENYDRMGKLLGYPLLEQPELALEPEISARIMVEGMTRGISKRGDFTGLALEDFFSERKTDAVNARRIVNGMDRAQTIAGYYAHFMAALKGVLVMVVLCMSACRSTQVVSERDAVYADSVAVSAAADNMRMEEQRSERCSAQQHKATEEQLRMVLSQRQHEVVYDVDAPLDSTTGRRPVLREVMTVVDSHVERVRDEALTHHQVAIEESDAAVWGARLQKQEVSKQTLREHDTTVEKPAGGKRVSPWGKGVAAVVMVVILWYGGTVLRRFVEKLAKMKHL